MEGLNWPLLRGTFVLLYGFRLDSCFVLYVLGLRVTAGGEGLSCQRE